MKSSFKLDRTSNRFRICPHCGKEHMVKHLGRDFCSDHCADTHYNENRRLKKQAEEILALKTEIVVPDLSQGGTIPFLPEEEPKWEDDMKHNLSILDKLTLDEKHGSNYSIDDLNACGFKFGIYSTQGKNHNLPSGVESFFLIYKNYRMYRIDYGKILIKKIN